MDVFGHHDEVVEQIEPLMAIMLKYFQKEIRVCMDLEEPPAVEGHACNEERPGVHRSSRGRHLARLYRVTPAAEAGLCHDPGDGAEAPSLTKRGSAERRPERRGLAEAEIKTTRRSGKLSLGRPSSPESRD